MASVIVSFEKLKQLTRKRNRLLRHIEMGNKYQLNGNQKFKERQEEIKFDFFIGFLMKNKTKKEGK